MDTQEDESDYLNKLGIKKNNKKIYTSSMKDDDKSLQNRRLSARIKSQPQPSYEDNNSMDEDYETDETSNSSLFYEEDSKMDENGSLYNDDYDDNQDESSSSEFLPDTDTNSYTNRKASNKNNNDKKYSTKTTIRKRHSYSQSDGKNIINNNY